MATTPEQEEIVAAIERLALGERLIPLTDAVADSLYTRIAGEHSTRPQALWIWEYLRETTASRQFMDGPACKHLAAAVPDVNAQLLFFPGSDQDKKIGFGGDIKAIVAVLCDSFGMEYLIAPSDLSWIVGENHHDILFAHGSPVAALVAEMKVGRLIRES